ncbi:LRR receptor-like serine/threonine-protein kinase RGI1 isoform X2 [Oryza glaberrima]|uniref:LRR receptor-like serine/threonine-protein kinase RGI1 isoform X2 n=1 Tax=Oryza glaberrima TaxID=4538 RepID=UPI00224C4713|nr:LRR receptor-like serine/threonine-protein kinase RGI1 isoform X2 [Oryza glaberrima]
MCSVHEGAVAAREMAAAVLNALAPAATVAQLAGADAAGLVSAILQAVRAARRNRRECRLLARRAMMVGDLLRLLPPESETMRRPEVRRALDGLGGALRQALELVESCQESGAVRGLMTAGRQAEQFREVQGEINDYMLLFPVVSHIDITRRLDLIYGLLLPADSQPHQMPEDAPGSPGDHFEADVRNVEITAAEVIPFESNQTITEPFEFGEHQVAGHQEGLEELLSKVQRLKWLCWWSQHDSLGPNREVSFDWFSCFKIIQGIAEGLLYLHTYEAEICIVHRDLKPSNILLDSDMNAKIGDFGIAKTISPARLQDTYVSGTFGYIAPEYLRGGILSTKVDVYAYGVILLEIITGRRSCIPCLKDDEYVHLTEYAWDLWRTGRSAELLDAALRNEARIAEITSCIQIALLCVQKDPADRPSMLDVLAMLRDEKIVAAPKKPGDLLLGDETSVESGDLLLGEETSGEAAHWFASSGATCSSTEFTVPR